jgi:hypothetical protein
MITSWITAMIIRARVFKEDWLVSLPSDMVQRVKSCCVTSWGQIKGKYKEVGELPLVDMRDCCRKGAMGQVIGRTVFLNPIFLVLYPDEAEDTLQHELCHVAVRDLRVKGIVAHNQRHHCKTWKKIAAEVFGAPFSIRGKVGSVMTKEKMENCACILKINR